MKWIVICSAAFYEIVFPLVAQAKTKILKSSGDGSGRKCLAVLQQKVDRSRSYKDFTSPTNPSKSLLQSSANIQTSFLRHSIHAIGSKFPVLVKVSVNKCIGSFEASVVRRALSLNRSCEFRAKSLRIILEDFAEPLFY